MTLSAVLMKKKGIGITRRQSSRNVMGAGLNDSDDVFTKARATANSATPDRVNSC